MKLHRTKVDFPGLGAMETYCQSEDMLTVSQAAVRLGVSRWSVYRMIEDGILASGVRGRGRGRIVVPREECDHYLASLKACARRLTA